MRLLLTFCIVFLGMVNSLLSQKAQNWVGTNNGRLYFQSNSNHISTFRAPLNQSSTIHYILPRNPPLAGEALVYDNSGELIWKNVTASAGDIGSGTPASGTFTSLSANNNFSLYPTGTGAGNTGEIRWYELVANGTNYTAFKAADAMGSNIVYTLPSADGSSGNILTTNGSGTLSWTSTVTGSNVSASGNLTVNGNSALGDANTDITSLKGSLRVYDTDATNYTDIKGPNGAAQSSNLNFILPTNAGSSNNMLITDGSGNLSWSSAVNGSSVTASGDLAVGGNTTLGDGSGDITSLYGSLRVYDTDGSHYTDIKGGNGAIQAANLNFILPTDAGSSNNMLITDGSGNLSWSSSVNTTNVTASGDLAVGGNTSLGNGSGDITSLTGTFRVYDSDATHYTDVKGPNGTAQVSNLNFILPINAGSNNNMLITDGSGNLSWTSAVNGSNVTASGDLSVGGNTALGNGSGDITSLTGTFRVYDSDATHYTDIKGGDGTAQSTNLDFILPTNAGSNGQVLSTNGSGQLSWVTATPNWSAPGTIGSTTPNTGAFTTLSASGAMSLQPTGTGAGNTGEIRWYELAVNGTNYTAFKAADAMAVNVTYTLPAADGTNGQSLVTNGSGTLSWASNSADWASPGTIGSTTPNTGAFTTLSASGALTSGGNILVNPTGTSAGNTGEIRWYELAANGSNYTAFKATDAMAANVTYTLPATDGTVGQFLKTDGSGNLSWAASSSGADAASLQTYAVSASAPATGNSLIWNGTAWEPGNATSSVQKLVLSEGTELDIDVLRSGASFINDVNISAHAFFKMVNAGINTNINGIANGENGRIIYLFNSTTKNITFVEEHPGSVATNRMILGVANKTINPDQVAVFIYSTTKNRWILISTT